VLTIHGRRNSNQVIQLMWTVGELGLEHRRLSVGGAFGGRDTDAFGALNPNRLVPVIEDDGFVLWESHAIVRYLCRRYGAGGLLPDDPREAALADQWMQWTDNHFMPLFFPIFWGLIRTEASARDDGDLARRARETGVLLGIVEHRLEGRDYLVGDTLTMGDIPLGAMMFKYYTLPIERPPLPSVERWYARLRERPAYREHAMRDFGRNTAEWKALELEGG